VDFRPLVYREQGCKNNPPLFSKRGILYALIPMDLSDTSLYQVEMARAADGLVFGRAGEIERVGR